jgi:hypothetical protein
MSTEPYYYEIESEVLKLQNTYDIAEALTYGAPRELIVELMKFRANLIMALEASFANESTDAVLTALVSVATAAETQYAEILDQAKSLSVGSARGTIAAADQADVDWVIAQLSSEDAGPQSPDQGTPQFVGELFGEFSARIHPLYLVREIRTQLSDLISGTGVWQRQ